ncbi:hypothetical protein GCM10027610_012240 [Dactylosporangium cerinum]
MRGLLFRWGTTTIGQWHAPARLAADPSCLCLQAEAPSAAGRTIGARPARTVMSVTLRPSATWRDALLAVAAAGAACLALLGTDLHAIDPALRDPGLFAVAVTAGAGLSGFWWHTHPARWFAATTVAAVAVAAAGHYVGLLPWLVTAALCAVAARHPRRRSLAALATAVAGYTAITVAGIPDNAGDAFLSTVALLLAAWALGDGVRLRRARVAADLHAARSDAAAARQEAARATTEERLRIAGSCTTWSRTACR